MTVRSFACLAVAAAVSTGSLTAQATAQAQSVSVTLNGAPVNLSPPPQQRSGRVFVPLRGIFERLGASVVYQNGTINAQGNGRAVSLKIGSTQATVNGESQTLDAPPFVVGASTYVPLRFVSQALGAGVNYDAANKIVALSSGGAVQGQPPAAAAVASPSPASSELRLGSLSPGREVTVPARRPTIEATFADVKADPNTVRVGLDGLDITSFTSRSATGFVYSPPSDLQSMRHFVHVSGMDVAGHHFDERWNFTSGTSAVENTLTAISPGDQAQVGPQFTVSGRTQPGAQVVVQVGASTANATTVAGAVGSILGLGGGASVRNEVAANADGSFSTVISINAAPGTQLQMVVSSTDARTKAAAHPVTRMLTVR